MLLTQCYRRMHRGDPVTEFALRTGFSVLHSFLDVHVNPTAPSADDAMKACTANHVFTVRWHVARTVHVTSRTFTLIVTHLPQVVVTNATLAS